MSSTEISQATAQQEVLAGIQGGTCVFRPTANDISTSTSIVLPGLRVAGNVAVTFAKDGAQATQLRAAAAAWSPADIPMLDHAWVSDEEGFLAQMVGAREATVFHVIAADLHGHAALMVRNVAIAIASHLQSSS